MIMFKRNRLAPTMCGGRKTCRNNQFAQVEALEDIMTDTIKSEAVQNLLDRASGRDQGGGNPRLKAITRDLLEAIMMIIEKHDISEGEFWQAVKFLQDGAGEFGLIAPGVGLEHFLDLHMDAKDAAAGRTGGTPRTIEGPLYVEGAPLTYGKPGFENPHFIAKGG